MAWEEVAIAERHRWDEGLYTLVLDRVLDGFKPGQFVNLGLIVEGKRIKRAYSIGSAPGEQAGFFIVEVDGGALTPRILNMPIGEKMLINPRPAGFFTLDWVPDCRDLWMVASGTGLAPFISMMRTEEPWRRFERLILLHGARYKSQLAYAPELAEMAAAHPGQLVYVPVVSREPEAEGVAHGRVTTILSDGQLDRWVGRLPEADKDHVMLCGNPAMLDDMQGLLEARGMRINKRKKPGHITLERYW